MFPIFCAFLGTVLAMLLFAFAAYGAAISYADVKINTGHIPELSFHIGVLASTPLILAGIWTSSIAFAVGARPLFKWTGLCFFVSAAVFLLMLVQVPEI
jgi:hypothetical protein